jgi:general secretion pathway protein G
MTSIRLARKSVSMVCLMRSGKNKGYAKGFTLVELLVVLAILALLLTLAVPRYFNGIERAKEATLRHDLNTLRESIDKFYADTGKYPSKLEDLVERKYIRKLPIDPMTENDATWLLIAPEPPLEGDIYDIHSGALGTAKDGSKYSDW